MEIDFYRRHDGFCIRVFTGGMRWIGMNIDGEKYELIENQKEN